MDFIDTWAVKIAEAAVPQEAILAPVTVQAFMVGGEAYADLFRHDQKGTPGGLDFGTFQALFPYVLQGLSFVTPILTSVLSSVFSGIFLTFINQMLTKHEESKQKQPLAQLPDDPYRSLKHIITMMSQQLQKAGITEQKADLIVYRTLKVLLEDPEGAQQFLQKLTEKSHDRK
jgi:hypothetical protein